MFYGRFFTFFPLQVTAVTGHDDLKCWHSVCHMPQYFYCHNLLTKSLSLPCDRRNKRRGEQRRWWYQTKTHQEDVQAYKPMLFVTQLALSIRGNSRTVTNKDEKAKMVMFNLSMLMLRHNLKFKKTNKQKPNQKRTHTNKQKKTNQPTLLKGWWNPNHGTEQN